MTQPPSVPTAEAVAQLILTADALRYFESGNTDRDQALTQILAALQRPAQSPMPDQMLDGLQRIALLADGRALTWRHASEAIRIATSTLGKNPSQIQAERQGTADGMIFGRPTQSTREQLLTEQLAEADAVILKLKQHVRQSTLSQGEGQEEPCYYCGKPCNRISGNPGLWPIPLCHSDDPGITKWHHTECVTDRLIENQSRQDADALALIQEIKNLPLSLGGSSKILSSKLAERIIAFCQLVPVPVPGVTDQMRRALERARTVLGNMALENEGAWLNRWPISHEPLRGDARNLLPVIDAALSAALRPKE